MTVFLGVGGGGKQPTTQPTTKVWGYLCREVTRWTSQSSSETVCVKVLCKDDIPSQMHYYEALAFPSG